MSSVEIGSLRSDPYQMNSRRSLRAKRAFSLVEVMLAIGVAGFALIAIFGLLPVALNNSRDSIQQTEAANIATGIMTDLREIPSASVLATNSGLSSTSLKYGIDVAGAGKTIYLDKNGEPMTDAATARYRAVVLLTQPPSGKKTATYGSVVISWPAGATNASSSIKAFLAMARN